MTTTDDSSSIASTKWTICQVRNTTQSSTVHLTTHLKRFPFFCYFVAFWFNSVGQRLAAAAAGTHTRQEHVSLLFHHIYMNANEMTRSHAEANVQSVIILWTQRFYTNDDDADAARMWLHDWISFVSILGQCIWCELPTESRSFAVHPLVCFIFPFSRHSGRRRCSGVRVCVCVVRMPCRHTTPYIYI